MHSRSRATALDHPICETNRGGIIPPRRHPGTWEPAPEPRPCVPRFL